MQNEFNKKTAAGFIAKAKAATNQADADWFMRAAVRNADKAGTTVEQIEAESGAPKARCPHYAAIKAFAGAAREMGLNMADKDRARGAMGVYLGKRIESRSELTANDWENGIVGLKAGA